MKKGFLKKAFAGVLTATMIFTMSSAVTVFASENYTSSTLNHGTIAVTTADNRDTITIQKGKTATIAISPYQHIQYTGCMTTPYCPDSCGSDDDCFIVNKGCKCDTTPLLRTTEVTSTVADNTIVSVSEASADQNIGAVNAETVGNKVNGTVTLTGLAEGTTTVTVSTSLRDWVSTSKTYTVVVEPTVPTYATVADYDAYTKGVLTETDIDQTLYVDLTFNQELTITDKDALLAEVNASISFGSGLDASKTTISLSENKKTLSIVSEGWGAQKTGIFTAKGDWTNLTTADGGYAKPDVKIMVPNGITTEIVSQTVATADTNASVTTKIVVPEGTTRGMVHLVLLKNGQPVADKTGELDQYGGTFTSHFHTVTWKAADFTNNFIPDLKDAVDDRYDIEYTTGSDTFTITAKDSEPGDVLEYHVLSYKNNGKKSVNITSLGKTLAKAEKVDTSSWTAEKANEYKSELRKAEIIVNDPTYYSADDVTVANKNLTATIKELNGVKVVDVDAHTDYVRTETDAIQTLYVDLTFDKEMQVVDADALLAEVNSSIAFGSGLKSDKTTISLSEDNKTLSIVSSGWGAQVAGIFTASGIWTNLVDADGEFAAPEVKMMIPNGLGTVICEQTIATKDTNASVTTKIVEPEGCTRGMVHLVLLKNGQPVGSADGKLDTYGGTCTSHFHDFLNLTAASFTKIFIPALKDVIGDRYDVIYDLEAENPSDTFTITAKDSEPGDVLEFHILSYANNGTKQFDTSELAADVEYAKGLDLSKYTEESAATLSEELRKAEIIANDPTYYSVEDAEQAQTALEAAIKYLKQPIAKSMFTITTTNKTYTGKAITTKISSKLTKNTDYKVTYKNNTKVGTATVTITGKGSYTGTLTYKFKIVVAKAVVTKKAVGKNKLTLAWKNTGAKSYKVYYKVKGTSKWKTATVKTTKTTLKNLKSGKKYYVKVKSIGSNSTSMSKTYTTAKIK